jgi:DNA-directed RNA polymerase subunit RPC12/RpoP
MTFTFIHQPVESTGPVYCALCTHTVQALVVTLRKQTRTKPGQKCPRCSSSLDAAFALRLTKAA